jgi:transposase
MGDLDTASLLFSFPEDIVISSIRVTTTEVVLQIACRRTSAACPLCQQPSERVHGHYGRTVADLPCAGRRVILALTVRKFVCRTPSCPPPSSVRILGADDWAWRKGQTYGTILVDLEKRCPIELPTARRTRSRPGYGPTRKLR